MGGQDGWKHCPHCLGLNSSVPKQKWEDKLENIWRDCDWYRKHRAEIRFVISNLLQEERESLRKEIIDWIDNSEWDGEEINAVISHIKNL